MNGSAASSTPRIFVSHSHEDDAFCRRLIGDLRARLGEEAVWYDASGGLHGGDDWWERIVAEITARPYFLVVLSPHADTSGWVRQEMAIAFRQHVESGKRLPPVRLLPSPRRADWAGIHEFDFQAHADPERYAAAFAQVLLVLGIDPNARRPAPQPRQPQRAATTPAHVVIPGIQASAAAEAPHMPKPRVTATDQLANVIEVVELGRRTGLLSVEHDSGSQHEEGEIYFLKGRATYASMAGLRGREAYVAMSRWGPCRFSFDRAAASPIPNIAAP